MPKKQQDSPAGGAPPEKKVKQEALVDASTTVAAKEVHNNIKKDDDGATLILEWTNYSCDDGERVESLSADQLIKEGVSLGSSDRIKQNERGEWEERGFELKLVDSAEKSGKETGDNGNSGNNKKVVLASLSFIWWEDSADANLMNFNQLSQDLADFCRLLWSAAGRRKNQYCDMAIEFGGSPHSHVEVNDLIAKACRSDDDATTQVAYLDVGGSRGRQVTETAYSTRLMNGLIALLNDESTLITHDSDLSTLKVRSPEHYGFRSIKGGEFRVRPADAGHS